MTEQGFEVEFFPVGDGEHSGDAIVVRYGVPGNYKIMVYDGGTQKSGKAIVKHIKEFLGATRVDYVVNSHPDGDHASGLSVVMEELEVGELWMHRPWTHSALIRKYFEDGRITDKSLGERLKRKMAAAYTLERIAKEKNVCVIEPFQGDKIGIFEVLSPGKDWYIHTLIREFEKSPEQKRESALDEALEAAATSVESYVEMIAESWGFETLSEDVCTSAENESSVVLFGKINNEGFLFTGDAGIRALNEVAEFANERCIDLSKEVTFTQVPHHGSRNNVSTSALDGIFGASLSNKPEEPERVAVVSASKDAPKHPDLAVINAFVRRGFDVYATKGLRICFFHEDIEAREGWSEAIPLSFSSEVRAW
jgi:beta-lactamase superfamily II metal-dependent hydrolase